MAQSLIPWWKRWYSFIQEIPLEISESEYNELLVVVLKNGRLQLSTENAIYSYDDLYDNFYDTFKAIDINKLSPKDVLVLGLGLGSIPFMLEKSFHLDAKYTAVELDEEVIRLASKYSLTRLKSPIELICANAEVFVAICDEKFDLICVDIFSDDKQPEFLNDHDWWSDVKELLTPDGILVHNMIGHSPQDKEKAQSFYNETFVKFFPNSKVVTTRHNKIMVGYK